MASPQRVKVDRQGRFVIPQHLRDRIVETPGEVVIEPTPDGLLLRSITTPATVTTGDDGLPVIEVGRIVTNAEVMAAIDRDREER